jgi:iron complex outermembrane receptor protein
MVWASWSTLAFAQKSASPLNSDSDQLQEVVVTAQRYEENLQKSSLVIDVASGEQLRRFGVTQAADLSELAPSVQISNFGPSVQTYIRGVGNNSTNPIATSAIAYNVDGIYVARPEGIATNFYDIDRIEILKGPQGTLYGRDASGGAINIVTQRPVLNDFGGYANLELANFNERHFETAINAPLDDTLAVRGAFNLVRRDGYLSDGTDDDDQTSGRIGVLWRPAGTVSMLLSSDFSHQGGLGSGFTYLPRTYATSAWEGTLSPDAQAYLHSQNPAIVSYINPFLKGDYFNVSGELNVDLGFGNLTILPAYRHVEYTEASEPGYALTVGTRSNQTSMEARLGGRSARLDWIAGLYFGHELGNGLGDILWSPLIQDIDILWHPDNKSYAAYVQATLKLTDSFRLIGGARYDIDQRGLDGQLVDNVTTIATPFSGEKTFRKPTWKGGIEYDVGPQNMLFATVATGFKSGGINQEIAPNAYQPETLTAYELGSRNRFLDSRVQINSEIFYWDYKNKQEDNIQLDNSFSVNNLVTNAGKATIKGVNLDFVAKPTAADTLSGSVEYVDAHYDSFLSTTLNSAFGVQFFDPRTTGCPIGAATAGPLPGSTVRIVDCSGMTLPHAPQWSGYVTYDRMFNIGGDFKLGFEANDQFASARWLSTSFLSSARAPAYTRVNLMVSFLPSSDRWSIAAFVRNVTNATVYSTGYDNSFAPGLFAATIDPPRTYGIRLGVRF